MNNWYRFCYDSGAQNQQNNTTTQEWVRRPNLQKSKNNSGKLKMDFAMARSTIVLIPAICIHKKKNQWITHVVDYAFGHYLF